MNRTVLTVFCILALLMAGVTTANAAIINNSGFESGDFTGWDVYTPVASQAYVSTIYNGGGDDGTWTPVEGSYLSYLYVESADYETTLSQTIYLTAGDILTGWSAYDYNDIYMLGGGDDYAYVKITDETTGITSTVWNVDGEFLTQYANEPWTEWAYTAESEGEYTFVLGALNVPDNWYPSVVLLDGLMVNGASPTDPVPEPATLVLLGSGLMGLAGASRRKFRK